VKANAIENRIAPDGQDLYSVRGIRWAEHLLRVGAVEKAQPLTEANREICERENWQEDVARCDWILGWLDVCAERWTEARAHLRLARTTFTRGHMIYEIARVLVTEAEALLGQGHAEMAMVACERAFQLAAPRNYRLVHADALTVRARIWLAVAKAARARDDAEAALQLAEFCGYAWGQRDALELLATAYRRLGDEAQAFGFQQHADDWNRQLRRP
jgi:tetratricopeptide (TPR) repeat protein